jgi:hypothetical protein
MSSIQVSVAQSFCEGPGAQRLKFKECTGIVGAEILAFNEMVQHYDLKDTIQYQCVDNALVVSYQGKTLEDWKYNNKLCGQKLMLRYGKILNSFRLLASVPIGNGKSQVYEVIKPNKGKSRIIYKTYKENGILPYGEYVEQNCTGQVIVKGQYELLNQPSTYSYNRYDREKRANVTEVIESTKTSSRTGKWQFYNDEGQLLHEEVYENGGFQTSLNTMSPCEDFSKAIKYNYYTIDDKISPGIDLFNAVSSTIWQDWHITYDITHRGIKYYLNGQQVAYPFFKMEGKYKPWDYQVKNHGNNLLLEYNRNKGLKAYIPSGDKKGKIIIFNPKSYKGESNINLFDAVDFSPNGKYQKRSCKGDLLIDGHYALKDTLIVNREQVIDPNTYEQKWVETTIDQFVLRSGKWNYYNEKQEVILEENYPGAIKWHLASEYSCMTSTDEIKELSKYIPNPYLDFNTIAYQLSYNSWLSVDDMLGKNTYYLNGRLISAPQNISRTNYRDDYKFITDNVTIKLYSNTKTQSAFGKRKKKKKFNYTAHLDYTNGSAISLSHQKDKLKKQERKDGLAFGSYEERLCNGNLLVSGQYCHIDSIYKDTVTTFNPETYEETVAITEHTKASKKYGKWVYYNAEGILTKEEDLGDCKK